MILVESPGRVMGLNAAAFILSHGNLYDSFSPDVHLITWFAAPGLGDSVSHGALEVY